MLRDSLQSCSPLCNALLSSTVPRGGTYTLLLWLSGIHCLRIGRLGCFVIPRGYYTYTGSAKRGMLSRLHRHIHGAATQHWHIDYLRPYASVLDWQTYAEGVQPECHLNQLLMAAGQVVAPRFGSSDCRCASHLLHFYAARRPPWQFAASA